MDENPTIVLPRLPDESTPAYEARVAYITMGPGRSQEAVSKELSKSRQLIGRWSGRHGWVDSALRYDEAVSSLAAQSSAASFVRDVTDFRKRYAEAGRALYQTAAKMLLLLSKKAGQPPKRIEGKDGHWYEIGGFAVDASTLTIVSRALVAAGDLEGVALRIDQLLAQMDAEQS